MSSINAVKGGYYNSDFEASATRNAESKDKTSLDFDDFLKLIAAQMSNQDMNNPTNNTEFIAQMAQFSSLTAMNELKALNATSYSVGLLGKEVTVAKMLTTGELFTETGAVTGVGLYDGDPVIFIGDNSYSMSEIMTVGKVPVKDGQDGTNGGDTGESSDPGGTE